MLRLRSLRVLRRHPPHPHVNRLRERPSPRRRARPRSASRCRSDRCVSTRPELATSSAPGPSATSAHLAPGPRGPPRRCAQVARRPERRRRRAGHRAGVREQRDARDGTRTRRPSRRWRSADRLQGSPREHEGRARDGVLAPRQRRLAPAASSRSPRSSTKPRRARTRCAMPKGEKEPGNHRAKAPHGDAPHGQGRGHVIDAQDILKIRPVDAAFAARLDAAIDALSTRSAQNARPLSCSATRAAR